MNDIDKKWLTDRFGRDVFFDEPMWRHTTFGIGGPADAMITLKSDQQVKDVIGWAGERGYPWMIVGAGSNLLVRDGGIRGLVLKLADGFTVIEQSSQDGSDRTVNVAAGAGTLLRRLGKHALNRGLAGLNFALGIPATVGGALMMNAGAWGVCMADITNAIVILNGNGDIVTIQREQLRFSYRRLELEKGSVILRGEFRLKRADRETLQKEALEMQRRRRLTQPLSFPGAGCIFRNPQSGMSAGELIEKAGLKGFRVGNAEVSTKHANFILNTGGACAAEVIALMKHVQQEVLSKFEINLEPEVRIVGEEIRAQKLL
ncbi:MAG: UDP-N-acetylmuramate dehydrogenase [Deltaproteobacteria bacterium]|nr:UDP-N-acetylmuramate dehydrogenase [Deltaproteobacteria bacterium]